MGLFGGNDDETDDEEAPHRGGFEEKDGFDASESVKSCARVIDEEAEVVLYGTFTGHGFGLAAVPLKDTALELPEKSEE